MSFYFKNFEVSSISFNNGRGAQDPGILNFDGLTYIAPSAMASAYINNDEI